MWLAGCAALTAQQYTISTLAGGNGAGLTNGAVASAQFNNPREAYWAAGKVYVADTLNNVVRMISGGQVTTIAGNGTPGFTGDGGAATSAQLNQPTGVVVDGQGNIYIADYGNFVVRKVTSSGTITTFAGSIDTQGAYSGDNGPATLAGMGQPVAVALDPEGNNLYILDKSYNAVREVAISKGVITTAVGNRGTNSVLNGPQAIAIDSAGRLYICDTGNRTIWVLSAGKLVSVAGIGGIGFSGDGGKATLAQLNDPTGLAVDAAGNLYIGDTNNQRVRFVNMATGIISTIAGNGTPGYSGDGGAAKSASLNYPRGLSVDTAGNVYIADNNNAAVRILTPAATGPAPTISAVSNNASGVAGIVPNSWVSIYGSNFAASGFTDTWANAITNGKLPTVLDGVSVSIGGQPAYVDYVSAAQINVLAPNVGTGSMQVTVTAGGTTSDPFTVTSLSAQPAFFPWPNNYAVATHADFTLAVNNGEFAGATTVPAKPGEYIILWGTSFGATSPAAPVGVPMPASPLYSASGVTVTIGGQNATVYQGSATLAPGFAGLFQVTVQVPPGLANGDYPVVATIAGAQSPATAMISVHN